MLVVVPAGFVDVACPDGLCDKVWEDGPAYREVVDRQREVQRLKEGELHGPNMLLVPQLRFTGSFVQVSNLSASS